MTRRRSSPTTSRSSAARSLGGRPGAFLALEDKLLAEEVWAAAGVPAAPHRVVAGRRRARSRPPATTSPPTLGVVWSGDARDGFNGGGNYVRWVVDEQRPAAPPAFFAAALRPGAGDALPRRRAVLDPRLRAARRHRGAPAGRDRHAARRRAPAVRLRRPVDAGGTRPPADREEMRDVARRVGEHLQVGARLPRRVRHRRRAHRRRLPARPSSTPGCRPALNAVAGVDRGCSRCSRPTCSPASTRPDRRRRRVAAAAARRPPRAGSPSPSSEGHALGAATTSRHRDAAR